MHSQSYNTVQKNNLHSKGLERKRKKTDHL
jgi:hypothetical protein